MASADFVGLGDLSFLHPDYIFVPDFEKSCPQEYFDMLDALIQGRSYDGPATAVRGFHFSPKKLEIVRPQGGELYFFPERLTGSDMKRFAYASATARGWNGRTEEKNITSPGSNILLCY